MNTPTNEFDGFTAAVMLQCITDEESANKMADLYKSLKLKSATSTEVEEAHKRVLDRFKVGQLLKFAHSGRIGEFLELRTNTGGFYPANLFPMKVKIVSSTDISDEGVGLTFEYDESDFECVSLN